MCTGSQIAIARQDINGSIPEPKSEKFLGLIKNVVTDLDPTHENFRIEDTGLDIEIILVPFQYFGYKQFSRYCDICKDFRLKIPAIYCRYFRSWIEGFKGKS